MLPINRFLRRANAEPDRPALRDDLGIELTHGELAARARAFAAALNEALGEEKCLVALAARNHAAHVVAMFGIFIAGHAWLPVNPRAARSLNDGVNARLRPDLLILDEAVEACVTPLDRTWRFEGSDPDTLPARALPQHGFPERTPDDTMSVKLTGGTTGEPKAVAQTHRVISTVMDDLTSVFGIGRTDVNLAVAPLSHGAFHLLLPVLAAGGRHEIVSTSEPDGLLDLMAERGISLAFMPPTLIVKLMERDGARPERFRRLRQLIYSAAPMPPAQIARAQAAFGPKLGVMYGQVEAPVAIAAMSAEDLAESGHIESCGRPCPSTEVRIEKPDADGVGEILARGPLTIKSYLTGEPSPLDEEGWLHTGDLGRLGEDGYLFIRGRARDVLITGGFNVYPAQVEQALLQVAGVSEACVYGVADPYWGDRVEAVIVASRDVPDEALAAAVRDEIGVAAVPKRFHRADALPRNAVGKVVRRDVAALFSGPDGA